MLLLQENSFKNVCFLVIHISWLNIFHENWHTLSCAFLTQWLLGYVCDISLLLVIMTFCIRMIGYVTFGWWFIVCNIVQLGPSPGPKCLFVVHIPCFYFFMKISTPYILCFPLIARLSLCHIAQLTHRLWSNLYDIRLLLVIVNFVISMIGYVTFGWWYTK